MKQIFRTKITNKSKSYSVRIVYACLYNNNNNNNHVA